MVQESKFIPLIDQSVDWTIETAGIERPLAGVDNEEDGDATDGEENTEGSIESLTKDAKRKLSQDMIDRVREEYIGRSEEDTNTQPPSQSPDNREGYDASERDALQDLIEERE